MTLNLDLLPQVAAIFILMFARIGTMVMLMPAVGEASVPARFRLSIAVMLSLMFLPLPTETSHASDALRHRIEGYIRDQIRDPELTIDKIAGALRCSKRYLHMAFAASDRSIADHIWTTRLDGCRGDLERHADRTISEIAFAWGFSSSAHFSRSFRKRFGVTPSEFRRGDRAPPG